LDEYPGTELEQRAGTITASGTASITRWSILDRIDQLVLKGDTPLQLTPGNAKRPLLHLDRQNRGRNQKERMNQKFWQIVSKTFSIIERALKNFVPDGK